MLAAPPSSDYNTAIILQLFFLHTFFTSAIISLCAALLLGAGQVTAIFETVPETEQNADPNNRQDSLELRHPRSVAYSAEQVLLPEITLFKCYSR